MGLVICTIRSRQFGRNLCCFPQDPLLSLSRSTFYTPKAPPLSSAVVAERRKLQESEAWEEPEAPEVPATPPGFWKAHKYPASPQGPRR